MEKEPGLSKRAAFAGIFVAAALILGYVESLIPFNFGVPGIKLGLANLAVVSGLYLLKLPDVLLISLVRVVISGLLFGNLMSVVYSLSGAVLSFAVMVLLKKTGKFSIVGVSLAGGVFHNTGQILTGMIVTAVPALIYYLPVLIGTGILTGIVMGLISGRVLKSVSKNMNLFV